ncbi:MAG: hypothetical protein WKF37_18100 [Bryobacteraceae bacterium]
MPFYCIHRLKEVARQQFRWLPHTIGLSAAKRKDYEPVDTVEGASPYRVWLEMKDSKGALQPGDILESDSGELRIYKYVGFEEIQWQLPDIKTADEIPSSLDQAASTQ